MPKSIYSMEERKQRKKEYDNRFQKSVNYRHMRKYYQTHRERILEKLSEKHECPCGGKYANSNRKNHLMSNKHFYWLVEERNG